MIFDDEENDLSNDEEDELSNDRRSDDGEPTNDGSELMSMNLR